ncbi:MAG TPA: hypothetical protein VG942_03895 [Hyphomonadaceae bacterium]|nr:hypothetical protein [Hyphomonadaceae bacterium]
MPQSDEHFLVVSDKLKGLNDSRSGWEGAGVTLALGVCVPSLINALAAQSKHDETFYWNSIAAWVGAMLSLALLIIAVRRKSKFSALMEEITTGKRYVFDSTTAQYVEASPKSDNPKRNPISALFAWLSDLTR